LNREIDSLKREVRDKDSSIKDLNERFAALKDAKKADEERQQKEKEILVIRNVRFQLKFV
jgi:uncharacterized coiled-coil DUF342 family protein